MKKGDRVRVGKRAGIVRGIGTARVLVELADDNPDPPSGYSAWWKRGDVTAEPPSAPAQTEMFGAE